MKVYLIYELIQIKYYLYCSVNIYFNYIFFLLFIIHLSIGKNDNEEKNNKNNRLNIDEYNLKENK